MIDEIALIIKYLSNMIAIEIIRRQSLNQIH